MVRYTPLRAHAGFVLMQEGKEEQKKGGARPYNSPWGQALGDVSGLVIPLLVLHGCAARKRPSNTFEAGTAARRLVVAATAGAVAEGGATIAGRGAAGG